MPKYIIIDLNKSFLESNTIIGEDSEKGKHIRTNLKVEIAFKKGEFEHLQSFIKENENFKNIKIQIPAYINFKKVLTKNLANEAKLLIKINEEEKPGKTTILEYF